MGCFFLQQHFLRTKKNVFYNKKVCVYRSVFLQGECGISVYRGCNRVLHPAWLMVLSSIVGGWFWLWGGVGYLGPPRAAFYATTDGFFFWGGVCFVFFWGFFVVWLGVCWGFWGFFGFRKLVEVGWLWFGFCGGRVFVGGGLYNIFGFFCVFGGWGVLKCQKLSKPRVLGAVRNFLGD